MKSNIIQDKKTYQMHLQKEAEFWGKMAEERWKGGVPLTMDYQLATRYRVKREALGWGDYIQDPELEALTPFGSARTKFIEFAKKSSGERALDLCCGAGFLTLELARAGKSVDAIDYSEREINVAKKYQRGLKEQPLGKINWIIADLNNYKLPTEEYDLVTAWDGLHHIPNIDRLCNEIYNSLKPGGVFLFCERIWGGEEQTFKAKISQAFEITLNVCLPLAWPYSKRVKVFKNMLSIIYNKYILKRNVEFGAKLEQENHGYSTPFEDSIGVEMLSAIGKFFEIANLQKFGAFSEEACRSLDLPRFLRIPAILFLSWFDYLWVKSRLLEGKIFMGYAKKRK
ncbi:MAG: class I SAM-dependent methyltransferase [Candidatus Omnitrophica bacterium]|nr:class I SAM-dependent methyltransferase [Candidatus Omnitrophota bacterium]MBU1853068.1 class I SAM-dependent methyltransferase [Candidatus Omnitrophota bacterium]